MNSPAPLLLLAALAWQLFPGRAHAAEDFSNCTGFVDSVPAVLTSPGYYCLRGDLATAAATGSAITVQSHDVTVDCNDYKLGGLTAGTATQTRGIGGNGIWNNTTIRRCNLRGFMHGISLYNANVLVEDNRLEGNTLFGIAIQGKRALVRRNLVINTGGTTALADYSPAAVLVASESEVSDNVISVVRTHAGTGAPSAVYAWDSYQPNGILGSIHGNRISGLQRFSAARYYAIQLGPGRSVISNNQLAGAVAGQDAGGILCGNDNGTSIVRDNTLKGFSAPVVFGCIDGGGNVSP